MSKTMVMKRAFVYSLLSLGLLGNLKAQTTQDSIRVNLDQALEIALSDNPTIQVAENTIQLKKYTKKETIAGIIPNISANAGLQHAIELQKMKVDFSPEPIALGQKNSVNANFNLTLPVIAPQLWKTIQLNEQDVQLSIETARSSKIDMVQQVKMAYFSLMLAKEALATLEAGYKNAEMNNKLVNDKFSQGLVSEYDKLVADVQLRNQYPQVINGRNAVNNATYQLKTLMGIDIYSPIIFEGNLSDYEKEMFDNLLEIKSDTSLHDNSALRQLDIQKRQLETAKKINRLGYAPTLGLSLNYGWQGMENNLNLADYEWFRGSTLGLSLTIPIFDGGAKYFKNKQNKVSQINLELQRDNIERQLRTSVASSLGNIETAIEQVESTKATISQAKKAVDISQKSYGLGSMTVLELNNSETALTQARLSHAQSIYDYLSAKTTLEATLGKTIQK